MCLGSQNTYIEQQSYSFTEWWVDAAINLCLELEKSEILKNFAWLGKKFLYCQRENLDTVFLKLL